VRRRPACLNRPARGRHQEAHRSRDGRLRRRQRYHKSTCLLHVHEEFPQAWHAAVTANDEQRICPLRERRNPSLRLGNLAPPLRRSISGRDALSASSKVVIWRVAARRTRSVKPCSSFGTRCIRWPTAGNGLSQYHRLSGRKDSLPAA
jgi:hypothetical protein